MTDIASTSLSATSTFNIGWEPIRILAVYSPPGPEAAMRASAEFNVLPPGRVSPSAVDRIPTASWSIREIKMSTFLKAAGVAVLLIGATTLAVTPPSSSAMQHDVGNQQSNSPPSAEHIATAKN